jgi:hypothetical protein
MNEVKGALAGLAVRLKKGGVAAVAVARSWIAKARAQPRFLAVIGAAVVLAIGLSVSLVHASSLASELADETGKFDRAIETLDARTVELATVTGDLRAAARRETLVAAAEVEQDERSLALDARETAVSATEDVVASNTIAGDGTFRVGVDIQPGQYHSEGGESCYWARLSANGDDIIDNDLGTGPAVLTVQASDGLIKTSRCAPFIKAG